jgi:hypothetical protein
VRTHDDKHHDHDVYDDHGAAHDHDGPGDDYDAAHDCARACYGLDARRRNCARVRIPVSQEKMLDWCLYCNGRADYDVRLKPDGVQMGLCRGCKPKLPEDRIQKITEI